jgi:hypothetical protein
MSDEIIHDQELADYIDGRTFMEIMDLEPTLSYEETWAKAKELEKPRIEAHREREKRIQAIKRHLDP